ncbi:hypothetical protein HWQ46_24190 [Shewanella sp. D64]|uniref:hypothetical protein n=1 Tax=unclassified Shewanella TaxID=196818 RepID=UPI0022BA2535|nr:MULTISPECIES: hypothetical protein [unclassified Shewanella]MEC4728626.1 hypothetical protein [Shewanella sp. D64]MEC4737875.1 hypothetical protein [Shewanella sp. E94]WBJ93872.1 hypothetical protein HWQ47_18325 [Shewanella sp. MTB7]
MNKVIFMFSVLFSVLFSANSLAADNVFYIDRSVPANVDIQFVNNHDIQPDKSDFEVVNYIVMSNEDGERKAVVTLRNSASGERIFESSQLHALFADGKQRAPSAYKQIFAQGELISMTLSFGHRLLPILQIFTRQ